jgi:hypothetical protein
MVTTAWSEQSIFLRMIRMAHAHDPDIVRLADPGPFADRERLAELAQELPVTTIEVADHPLPLAFASADAAMALFEETSGPVQHLSAAFVVGGEARGLVGWWRRSAVGRLEVVFW